MQQQIIIQVNSLEQCRYFYRETLKLGEPVIDSSELAVFNLDSSTALVLEQTAATYLEHSSSATAWAIEVENFSVLSASLEEHGFTVGDEFLRLGRLTRQLHDPESNILYIVEKKQGARKPD